MARLKIVPEQGALVTPITHNADEYRGETVLPLEKQVGAAPKIVVPVVEGGPATKLYERSPVLLQALGQIGVIAQTAPAINIANNPRMRKSLQFRYGAGYKEKVEEMQEHNRLAQGSLDKLFKKMWGLEEVEKSGLLPQDQITANFNEDKKEFVEIFSKSPGQGVQRAKLNRQNYRYRIKKQEETTALQRRLPI